MTPHCSVLLFLLTAASSLCATEGCGGLGSCVSCTGGENSLNISCEWMICGTAENSSCVPSGGAPHESCRVSNISSMCAVPERSSAEVRPKEDAPAPPGPSHPVFHTGSFIGGGVLVIILQVIGYFVLRGLQGAERGYETMEETPQ